MNVAVVFSVMAGLALVGATRKFLVGVLLPPVLYASYLFFTYAAEDVGEFGFVVLFAMVVESAGGALLGAAGGYWILQKLNGRPSNP